MPEYRKLEFKLKEDLWPVIGYRSFKKRNGNSLSYLNGMEEWKQMGLMMYHTLWYAGIAIGTLLAISYAMR